MIHCKDCKHWNRKGSVFIRYGTCDHPHLRDDATDRTLVYIKNGHGEIATSSDFGCVAGEKSDQV